MPQKLASALLLASATLLAAPALVAPALATSATPLVDTAWLQANLTNQDVVILDVRNVEGDRNPYLEGHIPGAVAAPYNQVAWRTEVDGTIGQLPPLEDIQALIESLGVDSDEHVVIVPVGASSSDFGAATRIYWTFKVLGHDAVSILDGGQAAWTRDGGPLSSDPATIEPGTFTVAFRDDLLSTAAEVALAIEAGTQLVDGRPQAQFIGTEKSDVVARAGTLPGAVNVEQARLYDAAAPRYADAATVAAIASDVGVSGEDPSITFCNTGHWASIVWFGLSEVAGYQNVSMYDGSMVEWAADPARPVVTGAVN